MLKQALDTDETARMNPDSFPLRFEVPFLSQPENNPEHLKAKINTE